MNVLVITKPLEWFYNYVCLCVLVWQQSDNFKHFNWNHRSYSVISHFEQPVEFWLIHFKYLQGGAGDFTVTVAPKLQYYSFIWENGSVYDVCIELFEVCLYRQQVNFHYWTLAGIRLDRICSPQIANGLTTWMLAVCLWDMGFVCESVPLYLCELNRTWCEDIWRTFIKIWYVGR